MWVDGSYEKGFEQGGPYSRKAGNYYGGHLPCTPGNNNPLCGVWQNSEGNNMSFFNYLLLKYNIIKYEFLFSILPMTSSFFLPIFVF